MRKQLGSPGKHLDLLQLPYRLAPTPAASLFCANVTEILCQFYNNRFFALSITDYFLSLWQKSIINFIKITTMSEDKIKKQNEEQLQDEHLDEVSGGVNKELKNPGFIRS